MSRSPLKFCPACYYFLACALFLIAAACANNGQLTPEVKEAIVAAAAAAGTIVAGPVGGVSASAIATGILALLGASSAGMAVRAQISQNQKVEPSVPVAPAATPAVDPK